MDDKEYEEWKRSLPVYTPTPDEIQAIERAEEQYARGEFTRYTSFEEMELDIMNDDEEA